MIAVLKGAGLRHAQLALQELRWPRHDAGLRGRAAESQYTEQYAQRAPMAPLSQTSLLTSTHPNFVSPQQTHQPPYTPLGSFAAQGEQAATGMGWGSTGMLHWGAADVNSAMGHMAPAWGQEHGYMGQQMGQQMGQPTGQPMGQLMGQQTNMPPALQKLLRTGAGVGRMPEAWTTLLATLEGCFPTDAHVNSAIWKEIARAVVGVCYNVDTTKATSGFASAQGTGMYGNQQPVYPEAKCLMTAVANMLPAHAVKVGQQMTAVGQMGGGMHMMQRPTVDVGELGKQVAAYKEVWKCGKCGHEKNHCAASCYKGMTRK